MLTFFRDERKSLSVCGVAQVGAPAELDRVLLVAFGLGVSQQLVNRAAYANHSDGVWVNLTKDSPEQEEVRRPARSVLVTQ